MNWAFELSRTNMNHPLFKTFLSILSLFENPDATVTAAAADASESDFEAVIRSARSVVMKQRGKMNADVDVLVQKIHSLRRGEIAVSAVDRPSASVTAELPTPNLSANIAKETKTVQLRPTAVQALHLSVELPEAESCMLLGALAASLVIPKFDVFHKTMLRVVPQRVIDTALASDGKASGSAIIEWLRSNFQFPGSTDKFLFRKVFESLLPPIVVAHFFFLTNKSPFVKWALMLLRRHKEHPLFKLLLSVLILFEPEALEPATSVSGGDLEGVIKNVCSLVLEQHRLMPKINLEFIVKKLRSVRRRKDKSTPAPQPVGAAVSPVPSDPKKVAEQEPAVRSNDPPLLRLGRRLVSLVQLSTISLLAAGLAAFPFCDSDHDFWQLFFHASRQVDPEPALTRWSAADKKQLLRLFGYTPPARSQKKDVWFGELESRLVSLFVFDTG